MNRSVVIYGLLLVAALVGSYVSWTSDTGTSSREGPTITHVQRENIRELRYDTDAKTVVLEPRKDDRGTYVWVRETKKPGAPEKTPLERFREEGTRSPDAGDAGLESSPDASNAGDLDATTPGGDASSDRGDAGTSSEGESSANDTGDSGERETRTYLASGAADQVLDALSPLSATRTLEVTSEEARRQYGFDEPRGTLTIRMEKDESVSFEIGGYAYGRDHTYIREKGAETAYVIASSVINPLDYSDIRLSERNLSTLARTQIDKLALRKGGERVVLNQHNIDDPKKSYWSVGESDERHRSATSWAGKLLRLQAQSYHPDPPSGLEPVMTVELRARAEASDATIEFFTSSSPSGKPDWYARSKHTRTHVRLDQPRAASIIQGADPLFN